MAVAESQDNVRRAARTADDGKGIRAAWPVAHPEEYVVWCGHAGNARIEDFSKRQNAFGAPPIGRGRQTCEFDDARKAYDVARAAYRKIRDESAED